MNTEMELLTKTKQKYKNDFSLKSKVSTSTVPNSEESLRNHKEISTAAMLSFLNDLPDTIQNFTRKTLNASLILDLSSQFHIGYKISEYLKANKQVIKIKICFCKF